MPTGPAGIEYDSVEAMDGRSPIILKAIPKISIIVKFRRNSCLYPSFAGSSVSYLFRVLPDALAYPEQLHHPRLLDRTSVLTLWKPSAPRLESSCCRCNRSTDVQPNAGNASRDEDTRSGKDITRGKQPHLQLSKILRHPTWRLPALRLEVE